MANGLLLPSATQVPRFKGRWIVPNAMRDNGVALADHRIVMITASPGSGKSRLLAKIHGELDGNLQPCAWLRVVRGTRGAGTLARHISTVLVRCALGERSATGMLLMAPAVDPDVLTSVALGEVAALERNLSLFLDDLHAADKAAMQDVQTILDGAPHNLRILMASRTPTGLRLARQRNQDDLLEIDDNDLAVNFKQLGELVAETGAAPLTLAETRALWARTKGRVSAVRLLARNRVRGVDQPGSAEGFVIGRDILDYFDEELFVDLSAAARRALDPMLVPHRLDHDLMIALAGGDQPESYIREFRSHGLLVRQSHGQGTTYEAIPLLVDVLRMQSLCSPDELAALHRRCCDWFEARGNLALAASHAMDAGDVPRAVALVERCGFAMIAQGQVYELQGWLERFTLADLRQHPMALLVVAWVLSLLYRLDEAEGLVAHLRVDLVQETALRNALEANLGALQVMISSMRDDFAPASAVGRQWRARYPQSDDWFGRVVDNAIAFSLAMVGDVAEARLTLDHAYLPASYQSSPYATVYARCILGLIDLRDAQVRHAEAHFSEALRRAEADMDMQSTGTVMAAGLLAGALYELNDIERAEQVIEGFAWSLHAHLFTDARFQAYRTKARILSGKGQYRAAITALETVLDAGPAIRLPRVYIDVLFEKIAIALDHHDTRMASAYIRALTEQHDSLAPADPVRAYADAALLSAKAHYYLEVGTPEIAIEALRRAIRLDLRGGWYLRAMHHAVTCVRALHRSRQTEWAMVLMKRLVRHAAQRGIVRTIVDGGRDIQTVLDGLALKGWRPSEGRQSRLFHDLRVAFDPELEPREEPPLTSRDRFEPVLTERELQLVRLVRAGLTNRQIAERMRVSENTIKWHLKNVFEKTSVSRRSDLAGLVLN